jgi:hypothetical protein
MLMAAVNALVAINNAMVILQQLFIPVTLDGKFDFYQQIKWERM